MNKTWSLVSNSSLACFLFTTTTQKKNFGPKTFSGQNFFYYSKLSLCAKYQTPSTFPSVEN